MTSTHDRALDPLVQLANLTNDSAAVHRFLEINPFFLENLERESAWNLSIDTEIFRVRDEVQELWRGGERADQIAQKYLITELISEVQERLASTNQKETFEPVRVDWKRGELRLAFSPGNDFRTAIYGLLKVSRFAKECANPECPAPYFIAKKIIQQYCGDDCKHAARKKLQNAYWARSGSKVRKERMRKSKGRKRGKS
jgi:hypothetical protein